ncbi:MAG: hypothetical protein ACLP50_05350 [Solirubrobacteraceae bacterium]
MSFIRRVSRCRGNVETAEAGGAVVTVVAALLPTVSGGLIFGRFYGKVEQSGNEEGFGTRTNPACTYHPTERDWRLVDAAGSIGRKSHAREMPNNEDKETQ